MALYPTVFIDRDGTINIDAGYINDPDNFVIYPYAPQAVKMLNDASFLAIIITNQSGLGRGFFTMEVLEKIHEKMYNIFQKNGAKIDGLYLCPHDPNAKIEKYRLDCDCRKPKTGLIEQAFKELPIDKNKMYFIGDKYSDMQTGFATNCKTIMVETGYGKGELLNKSQSWKKQPNIVAKNLLDGVRMILNKKL